MSELEEYKDYYYDSKLRTHYFYKNGLREGVYKSYYLNGEIRVYCYLVNDFIEGEYMKYRV